MTIKSPSKRRKYWTFSKGEESWFGDCPKWVAAMRRSRPDMTVTVGIKYGPRSHCPCCSLGLSH